MVGGWFGDCLGGVWGLLGGCWGSDQGDAIDIVPVACELAGRAVALQVPYSERGVFASGHCPAAVRAQCDAADPVPVAFERGRRPWSQILDNNRLLDNNRPLNIKRLNRNRLLGKNRLLDTIRLLNKPRLLNKNRRLDKPKLLNSIRPIDSIL